VFLYGRVCIETVVEEEVTAGTAAIGTVVRCSFSDVKNSHPPFFPASHP
jgi:hypothetical protein